MFLLTWMFFIINMKKVLLKPIKLIFGWWSNQKLGLLQWAQCGMSWSFYMDGGYEKNCEVPLKIEGADTFCTLYINPPSYCMTTSMTKIVHGPCKNSPFTYLLNIYSPETTRKSLQQHCLYHFCSWVQREHASTKTL